MTHSTLQSYQKVLASISDYQSSILEDFLLTAKSLSDQLSSLCNAGIDHNLHICFKDSVCENYKFYTVLDKNLILNFKNFLDNVSNLENPIESFSQFTSSAAIYMDLLNYSSFSILDSLADNYMLSKKQ